MNLHPSSAFSLAKLKRPGFAACLLLAADLVVFTPTLPTARAGGGMWVHGRYWPDAKPRKPVKHPFEEIESVNVAAGTVIIAHKRGTDHSRETLKVTQATEIMVNSQRSDLSALKKGMRVDVTHGTDTTEASRIVVGNG